VIGLPEISDSRSELMLLYGDAALERIEVDILGVREFAVKIAESMLRQNLNHGLIYGLEGVWGSGKSTLANEILSQVHELHGGKDDERPIIVRFDPWIQRGVQPLVGALLEEIKAEIIKAGLKSNSFTIKANGSFQWTAAKAAKYRNAIIAFSQFTSLLSDASLAEPTGVAGFFSKFFGQAASKAIQLIPKESDDPTQSIKTLRQEKGRVDRSIRALNRQIIISIDDIDRLDPKEIIEVMRLVRSVADFSNTIYLLNYDPRIVAQAAKQEHGVAEAKNYINKIVNVPIRVPAPEAFTLRAWFEREALKIISDWNAAQNFGALEVDGPDLHNAINSAGDLLLKTPRDVRRTLDSIRLALGSLSQHLWLPDLVWVSIIRAGSSELHNWIERYLTQLTHIAEGDATATELDFAWFDTELDQICQELNLTKSLLRKFLGGRIGSITAIERPTSNEQEAPSLYPKHGLFDPIQNGTLDELISKRRLSSPAYYRYYFSFQNPSSAILEWHEDRLREAAHRGPSFATGYLIELDSERVSSLPSKLEYMLRHLARTKMISLPQPVRVSMLVGIMAILDDTVRFEQIAYFSRQRAWDETAELLPFVFEQSDSPSNKDEVFNVFYSGAALSWLTYVTRIEASKRRDSNSDFWLNEWQFVLAKEAMLRRYSQMDLEMLLATTRPRQNFFGWHALTSSDETREFMLKNSKSDKNFLSCLELLQNVVTSAGRSNLNSPHSRHILGREEIKNFFDPDEVVERLNRIKDHSDNNDLSSRALEILNSIKEASQYRM
jgi:hypothetical protein